MPTLFLVVLLVAIGAALWRLMAVKDLAIAAAKKYCKAMDVQFLDGTVVQCGLGFKRLSPTRFVAVQKFQFEFTPTGARRYKGWTEFAGKRQVSIELEPHVFPDDLLD